METLEFKFPYSPAELLSFFQDEPFVFLLESSLQRAQLGRFSFLGFAPFDTFRHNGPESLNLLRQRFIKYQRLVGKQQSSSSPFPAGMMGFLSYDLGLSFEDIPAVPAKPAVPDCMFGFYDTIFTVDHQKQKLYVTSSGLPEANARLRKKSAQARLREIKKYLSGLETFIRLKRLTRARSFLGKMKIHSWQSNFTKTQYSRAVAKALEYIRRGDIYQVNLSQRFRLQLNQPVERETAAELYCLLQENSPACFGGYFDAGSFQIVSSSPELFLRLRGQEVSTRPMKGTRPRGDNDKDDRRQQNDLRLSVKDKAELLMITDLERNDLGRVCVPGSIRVREMRTLETYSTVFQATSTVEGTLRKKEDSFSLLRATFPGGSITGCPKIRSMQIIQELERSRRGIYTGSMGYINFNGDMDFNILIRTLLIQGKEIYFQVGGGIVADSNPAAEYHETLVKAKAMQRTLREMFTP